jgi:hypothetical protein
MHGVIEGAGWVEITASVWNPGCFLLHLGVTLALHVLSDPADPECPAGRLD